MPIKFLKKIKLSSLSYPEDQGRKVVSYKFFSTKHVIGAYVFPCKDLKTNQPLFNDGFPSLIFMPQVSDEVILRKQGEEIKLQSAWVCCGIIQDTYWEVPDGLEYIMVLRFNPSSFYSLFNVTPSVFRLNPICNLESIVGENWISVFNLMYEKRTLSQKISFLNDVLSSYQTNDPFPHLLNVAIEYIEDRKGNTTVSEVLGQLGKSVSPKWLHRNFVKYIGIFPKKFISLQRFIYTYGEYEKNRLGDLFDVALHSGYYDYNHFFKDFKRYIGIAPSQYAWE